jgi:hypothetical protein
MEPERSLPCSQEPATGHYPESDIRGPVLTYRTKIFLFAVSNC